MPVLWLTGASGFLGRNLLQSPLLESFEVVAVLRNGSDFRHPNVSCVALDDLKLKAPPPQVILHAATDYGRMSTAVGEVVEANLALPLRLVDLAGPSLKSFVAIDSYYNKPSEVYPHLESYCISKRMLIEWLRLSKKNFGIARVFLEHIYGPNDRADKFVPNILEKLHKNEEILLTLGLQTRDFIYVADAAKAIVRICENSISFKANSFEEYQIGSGVSTSIKDFVLAARSISNSHSQLNFGALPERAGEIQASVADLSTLRALNLDDPIDLDKGLTLTWNSLRDGGLE